MEGGSQPPNHNLGPSTQGPLLQASCCLDWQEGGRMISTGGSGEVVVGGGDVGYSCVGVGVGSDHCRAVALLPQFFRSLLFLPQPVNIFV